MFDPDFKPEQFLEDLDEKAFEKLHVDENYYKIRDLVEGLLHKHVIREGIPNATE
jgi:hypothetical protein